MSKSANNFDSNTVLNTFNDIMKLEWILPETRAILERQHRTEPESFSAKVLREKSRKKIDLEDIKSKSSHNFNETARKRSDIQKWMEKNSLSALKLNFFDELKKSIDHKSVDAKQNEAILEALRETSVWNDVSLNIFQLIFV
jgi:hypothetical protein